MLRLLAEVDHAGTAHDRSRQPRDPGSEGARIERALADEAPRPTALSQPGFAVARRDRLVVGSPFRHHGRLVRGGVSRGRPDQHRRRDLTAVAPEKASGRRELGQRTLRRRGDALPGEIDLVEHDDIGAAELRLGGDAQRLAGFDPRTSRRVDDDDDAIGPVARHVCVADEPCRALVALRLDDHVVRPPLLPCELKQIVHRIAARQHHAAANPFARHVALVHAPLGTVRRAHELRYDHHDSTAYLLFHQVSDHGALSRACRTADDRQRNRRYRVDCMYACSHGFLPHRLRLGSGDDDCRHRASPLLALEPMLRISRGTHSCLRRIPIADGVGACTVRGRVSSDDPLIVVIDDDENLCRAVERVLLTAAYQVRTYTRATDYLAEADVIEAACVLADIRMPSVDGIQMARALHGADLDAPIVFMTATDDVDTVVTAMKLGALDLLAKPFTAEALLAATEAALQASRRAVEAHRSLVALWRLAGQLTPREAEVCALVSAGLPNKNVAARIGTTEKTVKVHRGRVMHKFG